MPPQPHPPVAEGAWLRPRPARQSPDCRRGRVHRHASRHPARVRLTAAAFPAQHIRSARSFVRRSGGARGAFGPFGRIASLAASLRKLRFLRRISGCRARVRRRARQASAGSGAERLVGIPPVASASAPASPAASRRPRLLRLVPPPPRHASRFKKRDRVMSDRSQETSRSQPPALRTEVQMKIAPSVFRFSVY